MAATRFASIYARIPAAQHRRAAAIARREHGGKMGRYIAHLIQADIDCRDKMAAKARKAST